MSFSIPMATRILNFLYGTILVQTAVSGKDGVHSRNVCIFADGEVDRCPTGTGVSGRAAIHHARGASLLIDETIVIESLIGTTFDVCVKETTQVGHLARGDSRGVWHRLYHWDEHVPD